jgi:hypothetical protein
MAFIDEVELSDALDPYNEASHKQDALKALLSIIFWRWFRENKNRQHTIKIWIITKRLRLGQMKGIFELVFGPERVY